MICARCGCYCTALHKWRGKYVCTDCLYKMMYDTLKGR